LIIQKEEIENNNDDLREAENFFLDELEKFEKIKEREINKVAKEVANSNLTAVVKYGTQLSLNF